MEGLRSVKTNGNGMVEVPKEAIYLMAGLKKETSLPITRITALLRVIDEALTTATDESFESCEKRVLEAARWAQEIVGELKATLEDNVNLIREMTLKEA